MTGVPPGGLPPGMGKAEAVERLAARAELDDINPWGEESADAITRIAAVIGQPNNTGFSLADTAALGGVAVTSYFSTESRTLTLPVHAAAKPDSFRPRGEIAFATDFSVLHAPRATICHFAGGPLVIGSDGRTVLRDFSSRYAGLLHHYDVDLAAIVSGARDVDGRVIVLADDVRPLNYCHWVVDWLPRLAFLGGLALRQDTFVAVPPITTAFERDTLLACGFDARRTIELADFTALRARELLVPSDLVRTPHPAHKAAPWVLSYLRATAGFRSLGPGGAITQRTPVKLYVSRNDAAGRRVVNEEALFAALRPLGYMRATMSAMSFAQQVALFASASHVVGPHGAGLTNFVFARDGATLIEIFAESYGMPTYYVLAAGGQSPYVTYVTSDLAPGARPQLDDMHVDVADFMARCADWL